jgi:hypothetical protein
MGATASVATGGNMVTGGSTGLGAVPATGGVGIGGTGLGTGGLSTGGIAGTGGLASSGGAPSTGGLAPGGGLPGTGGSITGGTPASGGITAGTGGEPSGVTLNDLRIEPNPNNNLSCFVSWTTEQPANSVVQFGSGALEWEIADDTAVTDHRVLVIGMHADQTYLIRASSVLGDTVASAEGEFTAGSLPDGIPVAEVTVNDPASRQPGWTLMNIQKGDGTASARSQHPAFAVMYDDEGRPVWYYVNGPTVDRGGAISVDLTDRGVLIGPVTDQNAQTAISPKEIDLAGETLWECPTPTCGGSDNLTHHAGKLPNGNYVIQRDVNTGGSIAPVYEILTPDNELAWSWDYKSFVAPPAGAMGDWCHGNSITVDIENDAVYANCRWMGLVKTTYQNPTFVWHLPASYGASGLGNMTFVPELSQYIDTHDPEIHDDGTILFYDNGGYSGVVGEEGNPNGYQSRAVEYQIDEAARTATLVWEFPGDFDVDPWYRESFYIPFWGDADRLENANVLVTAGVRGPNSRSRVFEVTRQDGQVVWEFQLPPDHGVYRSERITPPLVRPITP